LPDKASITCAILAGGASRRFGKNKLALEYRGASFLQLIVRAVSEVSDDIIVSGENCAHLNVSPCRCYSDSFAFKASIVGIHTALRNAGSPVVVVVAGDLPLLNPAVLRLLLKRYSIGDCDAVVPVVGGFLEPLVAVYAKRNLTVLEENIRLGKLKIVDFIRRIQAATIPEQELRAVDPELGSFMNINTRSDYAELLKKGLNRDRT